jgi:hypothetical protein
LASFWFVLQKFKILKLILIFVFAYPYFIYTKLDFAIEFGWPANGTFCTNQCIVYGINLISDCQFKQYTQSWYVSMFGDCHIWQTLLKFPLLIYNGVPIKISIKKHKLILRIFFFPIVVFFTFSSNKLLMMFSLQIQINFERFFIRFSKCVEIDCTKPITLLLLYYDSGTLARVKLVRKTF